MLAWNEEIGLQAESFFANNPQSVEMRPSQDSNLLCIKSPDGQIFLLEISDDKILGQGSAGKVFNGTNKSNALYAIKASNRSGNEGTFANEIQVLPTFQAHNSQLTLGIDGNTTYYTVMHNLGQNLDAFLAQNEATLTLEERYDAAIKVCLAVYNLHTGKTDYENRPRAHCDIKPRNILINHENNYHLVDLELATSSLSSTASNEGTSIYCLPSSFKLTNIQADILATMRTIYMEEEVLTPKKNYKKMDYDTCIFRSSDLNETILSILSTSCLDARKRKISREEFLEAFPLSTLDLAVKLALAKPNSLCMPETDKTNILLDQLSILEKETIVFLSLISSLNKFNCLKFNENNCAGQERRLSLVTLGNTSQTLLSNDNINCLANSQDPIQETISILLGNQETEIGKSEYKYSFLTLIKENSQTFRLLSGNFLLSLANMKAEEAHNNLDHALKRRSQNTYPILNAGMFQTYHSPTKQKSRSSTLSSNNSTL